MMLQSYEKSNAKQRNLFLFLLRPSNFALVKRKVTKKREQNKTNSFVFYAECMVTSRFYRKVIKSREKIRIKSFILLYE